MNRRQAAIQAWERVQSQNLMRRAGAPLAATPLTNKRHAQPPTQIKAIHRDGHQRSKQHAQKSNPTTDQRRAHLDLVDPARTLDRVATDRTVRAPAAEDVGPGDADAQEEVEHRTRKTGADRHDWIAGSCDLRERERVNLVGLGT